MPSRLSRSRPPQRLDRPPSALLESWVDIWLGSFAGSSSGCSCWPFSASLVSRIRSCRIPRWLTLIFARSLLDRAKRDVLSCLPYRALLSTASARPTRARSEQQLGCCHRRSAFVASIRWLQHRQRCRVPVRLRQEGLKQHSYLDFADAVSLLESCRHFTTDTCLPLLFVLHFLCRLRASCSERLDTVQSRPATQAPTFFTDIRIFIFGVSAHQSHICAL